MKALTIVELVEKFFFWQQFEETITHRVYRHSIYKVNKVKFR